MNSTHLYSPSGGVEEKRVSYAETYVFLSVMALAIMKDLLFLKNKYFAVSKGRIETIV
jgi:hypothetical protein